MKIIKNIFLFSAALLLAASCSSKPKTADNSNDSQAADTLHLEYASGFAVYYHGTCKEVVVYNPWHEGSVYARYYLTTDKHTQTPGNGTKVLIPLKTIALTSVTPLEFLSLLGKVNTISGICSPALAYNPEARNRIKNKEISDLGDGFNINVENTLALSPQALMTSGYNQNDPNVLRISQAGIPVLYNNEWMESSLLGRAEWIKFVSTFYNKEQEADSIFSTIVQKYNEMKSLVKNAERKPAVMSGSNFRGTWYMPGGKSFMGQLFDDAHAAYFYADDTTTGSLPLNIETVIMNFTKTDVWVNCSYNTIEELLSADPKHAVFRPVALNEVYNFNKRILPSGANDFWESAVARPDLLLADITAILHPSLLPDYELYYAEKLK